MTDYINLLHNLSQYRLPIETHQLQTCFLQLSNPQTAALSYLPQNFIFFVARNFFLFEVYNEKCPQRTKECGQKSVIASQDVLNKKKVNKAYLVHIPIKNNFPPRYWLIFVRYLKNIINKNKLYATGHV